MAHGPRKLVGIYSLATNDAGEQMVEYVSAEELDEREKAREGIRP